MDAWTTMLDLRSYLYFAWKSMAMLHLIAMSDKDDLRRYLPCLMVLPPPTPVKTITVSKQWETRYKLADGREVVTRQSLTYDELASPSTDTATRSA
ncbi:hypothetical protein SPRG_01147 [Saprolegnia parasitica CBS 223.65]|uniref:Uncharacterized protein n=1 Tax=Saprolegnia parasitica (strain CBS 223.65) TaxID=695850 RepID=A0A067D7U7_SAPPC|nr:hypothetical protein SPRG_01147 [Saprolegnia parasitica CBS 223.65]KDO35082.1 hypothetical protein SPRG_01147 [Saprolegnia parasitica CBS 223.65]|eukprot:XP_012194734.1 hypothetical protein SPRG_01147 [Saprolegnia parasitica CBS 223.65]